LLESTHTRPDAGRSERFQPVILQESKRDHVVHGTRRGNGAPEQLQETGAVTVNQALSKLHPSFNFPQGQNAVKGQGIRAASLRGVGPSYTLILVNGKRRNVSALLANTDPWPAAQVVDINAIPISAVDHIEVLRDGAAAQYGSDAIAGVIKYPDKYVLGNRSSGINPYSFIAPNGASGRFIDVLITYYFK
jgi:outer membrane receptor for ferrienterochelin and colicin